MIINDHSHTDFKTRYNIDKSHLDSEVVKISGKSAILGEVRKFLAASNEEYKRMLIFYDDIVQYTSIGLMDLVFELKDIPSNIPIDQFLTRKVPGNEFVKNICALWGISADEVDDIERKYYPEILRRSPFTKNAKGFLMMRQFLSSQAFVFRRYFVNADKTMKAFTDGYKTAEKGYVATITDFLNGQSISEYLNSIKKTQYANLEIVVTEHAGEVMDFIDKSEVAISSEIFTFRHNGLSDDQMATIMLNEGYGNGDYRVNFIEEGL